MSDYTDTIDYYAALAAQHEGKCVYHGPATEAMCDKALRDEIIKACACAYWENERFKDSLIDAPERLQAVFDVILGYTHQFGVQEVLQRLVDPSPATVDG